MCSTLAALLTINITIRTPHSAVIDYQFLRHQHRPWLWHWQYLNVWVKWWWFASFPLCAFLIFPDTFLPDTETLCSQLLAIFPPNFVAPWSPCHVSPPPPAARNWHNSTAFMPHHLHHHSWHDRTVLCDVRQEAMHFDLDLCVFSTSIKSRFLDASFVRSRTKCVLTYFKTKATKVNHDPKQKWIFYMQLAS